jgi:hypothetical protein
MAKQIIDLGRVVGNDGVNGTNGVDGVDGITPHIGDNGNWWIGEIDTGIKAQGQDGANGLNQINQDTTIGYLPQAPSKDVAVICIGSGENLPEDTFGVAYVELPIQNMIDRLDKFWSIIQDLQDRVAKLEGVPPSIFMHSVRLSFEANNMDDGGDTWFYSYEITSSKFELDSSQPLTLQEFLDYLVTNPQPHYTGTVEKLLSADDSTIWEGQPTAMSNDSSNELLMNINVDVSGNLNNARIAKAQVNFQDTVTLQ